MQSIREPTPRAVIVWTLVAALATTACATARSASSDPPAASARLYRNNGAYVPNPAPHDFGSQGP